MTEQSTENEKEEVVKAEAESRDVTEEEVKNHVNPTKEEDFKAKYYYLAAELENMRRRNEREKENLLKYGNEKVLSGLIGVVDNFDLSVNAMRADNDEKVKNIVKGIDMVRNQFLDVLKQNGLVQVEALGKKFDPNFHEALSQAPAEGKEDEVVLQVYQPGYTLNGRLLRAAKVVVVKN
jgi:molecular chaperone GrpE